MKNKTYQMKNENSYPIDQVRCNNLTAMFLTRRESAAYLKVSLAKFDQFKDIDFIKYGKSKRFSLEALNSYAKKHTVRCKQ